MNFEKIDLLPYVVNRLNSRLNAVWLEKIRSDGLTTQRWQVLSVLSAFDGCRITELAAMVGSEQSVVSRVIDQMQRDGLVERRPASKDSRVVEVWLCDAGIKAYQKLLPFAQSMIEEISHGFSEAETKKIMRLLNRVLAVVESMSEIK